MPNDADPIPTDPTSSPSIIDQARRALATAEGVTARVLDDQEWHMSLLASGTSPGAIQAAYLRHAQAAGIVALAEQVERVADLLGRPPVDRLETGDVASTPVMVTLTAAEWLQLDEFHEAVTVPGTDSDSRRVEVTITTPHSRS